MSLREGPASAGPFRVRRLAVLAALVPLLVASGCINPFADDVPEASPEPLPGLGQRPAGEPEAVGEADGSAPSASGAGTTSVPTTARASSSTTARSSPSTSMPAASGPTTTGQPSVTARSAARSDDPQGDAGLGGPAYADARLLVVEDLGTKARVTVKMAAALPAQLATEEVMGIGVDFFRTNGGESEYQLFADGGSDGWRAFLDTPAGFVDYPGEFRLGGGTVQFEVAWSDLGGRPTGSVSSFTDWGKPTVAGVVTRTQDLVPDRGRVSLAP